MHKALKLFPAFLLLHASIFAQTILFNEIMPINKTVIADEDGDFPDWLELYNPNDSLVNLGGYGLSDDKFVPLKWQLPSLNLPGRDFLLVFASDKNRHEILYWNTIVNRGDAWSFYVGAGEPSTAWKNLNFPNAWATGPSGFGYGDNDDATVLGNTLSVYVRKIIHIDNRADIRRALLHLDYDDGFIAYLNGQEVARANVGNPGEYAAHNTPASGSHEALLIQGLPPEQFEIADLGLLRDGDNVLAIQVHNVDAGSSDLTLIPFLTLGSASPWQNATPPPDILQLPKTQLHTNFKIKGAGEPLYLSDPNGQVIDSVQTPALPADISFGRRPDGGVWQTNAVPTPGAPNDTTAFVDFAVPPVFSQPGGLFASTVTVELSDSAGGAIYFTVDGSEPNENSQPYTKPITINLTTAVRARVYNPPLLPSCIITHTYILNENTAYGIVSLTTDPDNLFDYEYGIFEYGPNASPDYPYFGANFWQDWERPVHVEFFEPTGQTGFALDAGMKVFGGWSRGREQKSMAIFQRSVYDTRQIDYRIFPNEPIDHFESFLLRNGGNDWDGTIFRDAFMQTLCEGQMDLETMAFRPVHVYLNGDYWGLMNLREKLNEQFVAANRGLDPNRVDILDGSGLDGSQILAGTNDEYEAMIQFIQTHDLALPENYAVVDTIMDINNFIDYQVAEIFIGNTDWPGNNIKFYQPQTPGGKWRWLIYDTDFGFHLYDTSYGHNTLAFATDPYGPEWPNPPWSTFLLRSLLENEVFARLFINRFADHLNTTFHVERVRPILDAFDALYRPEIHRQRERWPGSAAAYSSYLQRMYTFAARRDLYMRSYIRQEFGLDGDITVKLEVSDPAAGRIKINSKIITTFPWQGGYFKNVPITFTAIPQPGYRFEKWQGLNSSRPTTTYDGHSNITVLAVFKPAAANADLVVNEVNYNSGENFPAKDWIELYNPGDVSLRLAGWQIKDAVDEHLYVLPEHAFVPAFGYAVIATDSIHFNKVYSGVENVYGNLPFDLSNTGDSIYLYDSAGQLVDSLSFDDKDPWPVKADGAGFTLELRDAAADNNDPAFWLASRAIGGSPGRINGQILITGMEKKENQLPVDFQLKQNYPNPFNNSTKIDYQLPQAGFVRLVVYDVLGRQVAVLAEKNQAAGFYSATWQANMPSGVYFYRLDVSGKERLYSSTKKLLLIR